MGEMEICMHSCPDEHLLGDINNCIYWEIERIDRNKLNKRCIICKKITNHFHYHHLDYQYNTVVPVCPICHRHIHSKKGKEINLLPMDVKKKSYHRKKEWENPGVIV